MSAQHFRKVPRPDMPSGEQIVEQLRDCANSRGVSLAAVAKIICGPAQNPSTWVQQMLRTKCPRVATVERVQMVLAGKTPPPLPERVARASRGRALAADRRVSPAALDARRIVERRDQARRLTTRHPLAIEGLPTPEERSAKASDLIRWANEEWPEIAFEVVAYAKEEGRSVADAWRSVITAGLQCLREA